MNLVLLFALSSPAVTEVHNAIDQATRSPELRAELRRVCERESHCNRHGRVGVHPRDAKHGRRRWAAAVRRGLLSPTTCPAHALGPDPGLWSTVGAFGTTAAFVVRHVGPCTSPRALFDPRVAARAAVGHARVLCRRQGACSCAERAMWWAGPGRWAERSPTQQLAAVTRQCGPQPQLDWALAYAELPIFYAERILELLDDVLPELEERAIAS